MDNLKILIVDDETLARQKIRRFLGMRPELNSFSIHEAVNGIEALKMIPEIDPDLVFLDVEMPKLSGFDVLSQLEKRPAKIIFQTAHDEFALRAFEESACDYLLKPFTQERFNQALDRALQQVKSRIGQLESAIHKEGNWLRNMLVKQGNTYIVLKDEDILYFLSKEQYTSVFTRAGEFVCNLSLNHLEERLDPAHFARLHRNSIIRIEAIKKFQTTPAETKLVLADGATLPVSRDNVKKLKNLFLKL